MRSRASDGSTSRAFGTTSVYESTRFCVPRLEGFEPIPLPAECLRTTHGHPAQVHPTGEGPQGITRSRARLLRSSTHPHLHSAPQHVERPGPCTGVLCCDPGPLGPRLCRMLYLYFYEFTSLLKKSLSDRPIDRIASKRSETTAKTLQNYGAESSIKAPRAARRRFSTGCHLLRTTVNEGKREGRAIVASAP
jgi:hypothetical protein